jgi:hypothetical protein
MKTGVALLLVLALAGHGGAAWAQATPPDSGVKQASHNVASVVATGLYAPLKAGLCILGGGSSGLVFLSSGPRAARAVAGAACEGTWVITADALRGKEPIEFVADSIPAPRD